MSTPDRRRTAIEARRSTRTDGFDAVPLHRSRPWTAVYQTAAQGCASKIGNLRLAVYR